MNSDKVKEVEKHLDGVNLTKIPKDSDLFTLKDFIEMCEGYGVMDDDGFGYYATASKMSDIFCQPSVILYEGADKTWSHVVWFNK